MPADATLRDEIASAFKSSASSDAGSDKAPVTEVVTPSEPASAPNEPAAARGADPKSASGPESAEKPLDPPARWTKEEKEEFSALDPKIQKILLTRNKGLEAHFTKHNQEVAEQRRRYTDIEAALAPRREEWTRAGMNDASALNMVLGYWDFANKDPLGFIQTFAQQRNIDLAQYFTPRTPPPQQQYAQPTLDANGQPVAPAQLDPAVIQFLEQLATEQVQTRTQTEQMQQWVQNQNRAEHQRIWSSAAHEYETFRTAADEHGNPKYPFFDDLRQEMALLMNSGVPTLADAYDKAVYANPQVRQKVLENERLAWRREDEDKRRKEADKAKRAGLSIAGSSSSTVPPPDMGGGARSLRDEIRAAMNGAQQNGRM